MSEKQLTFAQDELKQELMETYGLSPEQISFDGENIDSILDFEALCALREKLTNFKSVDVSCVTANDAGTEAEAICVVVTAENRTVTVSDFAQYGELMPDGSQIQNSMSLKRLARARAMRSGIRAAGVNLMKAHKHYLETGDTLDFQPIDPRVNAYKELHAVAAKIGLITGADKSEYQKFIGETFDGRQSAKDLDDLELQRLLVTFRAMARVQTAARKAA